MKTLKLLIASLAALAGSFLIPVGNASAISGCTNSYIVGTSKLLGAKGKCTSSSGAGTIMRVGAYCYKPGSHIWRYSSWVGVGVTAQVYCAGDDAAVNRTQQIA